MQSNVSETFGIEFPIFAFSHCRDVVAEVTRAGGLGVLGAVAMTPEQLETELTWIDERVGEKPYGVDVVMPASHAGGESDPEALESEIPERHRKFVDELISRYDVPSMPEGETARSGLAGFGSSSAHEQVDVALSHPISLLVNALGPPPKEIVDKAHDRGVRVAALVGTADQAEKQAANGVDIVVAQGTEAGGHTGEIATMVLVPEVVDRIHPVPVLAAGGIGSGRQIAAAIALGAQGAWTGSIWLTVAESECVPAQIRKLLAADSRGTVRSRALTGKPLRQLRTAWSEAWEQPDAPEPLPMPLQRMLVIEAQDRINRYEIDELITSPVGQIVGRMNEVRPVREVMFDLVNEFVESVQDMASLVD